MASEFLMAEVLDSRRLATFRAVAMAGRISEAARRLNLSQPAVTAQMRQLEEAAGRPLLTRHAHGIRLTPAGLELLGVANRLHDLLDEAGARLAAPDRPSGPLRLCASTTLAAYVLPSLLASFQRTERPASVTLEVGNTEQVLAWVREGRFPLGLVEGLRRAPGLRLELFFSDELLPVRAVKAPAAIRRARSLQDLREVPILRRESGSGTRAVVDAALRKADPGLVARDSDPVLGHTEAIKTAVLEGLGIAFLSPWSIRGELRRREVEVLSLPGLRIPRAFSWVRPSGGLQGAPARFHRFAMENLPAL